MSGRRNHRSEEDIPASQAAEQSDEAYLDGLSDGTMATGAAYDTGFADGATAEAIVEAENEQEGI